MLEVPPTLCCPVTSEQLGGRKGDSQANAHTNLEPVAPLSKPVHVPSPASLLAFQVFLYLESLQI